MKTKIIWRLKDRPTPTELKELVQVGILSKEEVREIMISSETEDDRDKKSLESEIKFLRDLVDKLSDSNRTRIIETIKEVQVPYQKYPWHDSYKYYCGGLTAQQATDNSSTHLDNTIAQISNAMITPGTVIGSWDMRNSQILKHSDKLISVAIFS